MEKIEIQDISWSWITKDFDIDPSEVVDLDIVEIPLGTYLRISYQKDDRCRYDDRHDEQVDESNNKNIEFQTEV